ncbi:uncharacterized protein DS421_3g76240 [Arachis hypogaea]|nr:uncharacterized protein DS421_3g76240 [Arachis hypogaea]
MRSTRGMIQKGRIVPAAVVVGGQTQHRQAEVNDAARERTGGIPPSHNMVHGEGLGSVNTSTHALEEGYTKVGAKGLEVSVKRTNVEWLRRSVIGSTTRLIDFRLLNDSAGKVWPHVVKVCDLGRCKALLIFDSKESAEEAERCDKRRVWIECYRVSLHVWTEDTFCAIGRQYGEVVVCDNVTASGSTGFEVFVKEMASDEFGSSDGVVSDVMKEHDGNMDSIVSRPRRPMQLGWWDMTDEEVALPNRVEEAPEGRIVISPDILDEWSNSFLNSKTVMVRDTNFAPREGRADLAEATSEWTQSWAYNGDRVVAVGEITSQGFLLGPDVDRVGGNTEGGTLSGKPADRAAPARCGAVGVGDHGSATLLIAERRREAGGGLDLEIAQQPIMAGGYPSTPPTAMASDGANAAGDAGSYQAANRAGGSNVSLEVRGLSPCAYGQTHARMKKSSNPTGIKERGIGSDGFGAGMLVPVEGGLFSLAGVQGLQRLVMGTLRMAKRACCALRWKGMD